MRMLTKPAPKIGGSEKGGAGFDMRSLSGMMDMLSSFPLLRLTGMMGTMDLKFTKEELLDMNAKRNTIKAPKK